MQYNLFQYQAPLLKNNEATFTGRINLELNTATKFYPVLSNYWRLETNCSCHSMIQKNRIKRLKTFSAAHLKTTFFFPVLF